MNKILALLDRSKSRVATAGAGVVAFLSAGAAMADPAALTTAVTTEVDLAKPEMYAIGGVVLAALAVILVIRLIKKSAN